MINTKRANQILSDANSPEVRLDAAVKMTEEQEKAQILGAITGTFDVLHRGHMEIIRKARERCDRLVIAVETDKRVQIAKGKFRPLFSQNERKRRLELALHNEIEVEILPENFDNEEVRKDWLKKHGVKVLFTTKKDLHWENKQFLMMEVGGRVEFLPIQTSVSTTQILKGEVAPEMLVFESDMEVVKKFRQDYEK